MVFFFFLVPICTVSTILHASVWSDHATEYATFFFWLIELVGGKAIGHRVACRQSMYPRGILSDSLAHLTLTTIYRVFYFVIM